MVNPARLDWLSEYRLFDSRYGRKKVGNSREEGKMVGIIVNTSIPV
jgi:hypothetical protein